MDYTLSLTTRDAEVLRRHLLGDRSREQMAVTLCGVNRLHRELRLLVRDVILLPPQAFRRQSAGMLEVAPEVQQLIHQRAYQQGLIEVDWHSHPGAVGQVSFSAIDDQHEELQAVYLAHSMKGVPYGSVVVGQDALDARLWVTHGPSQHTRKPGHDTDRGSEPTPRKLTYRPQAWPIQAIYTGDLQRRVPCHSDRLEHEHAPFISPVFDRQVRAFGSAFQNKMAALRVGLVGLGGLGSAMAEYLARLGVSRWVLVDPDAVEITNLNRLVQASIADARKRRPKVNVGRSIICRANPRAQVRVLRTDVFDPGAIHWLKSCDLLIAATDNHSSRMALNRLSVQYLIPLVHVGFNISVTGSQPAADANSGGHPRSTATGSGQEAFISPAARAQTGPTPEGCQAHGFWPPAPAAKRHISDVSGEFAIPDLGRWCLHCAGLIDPQQAAMELAPATQRRIFRERGYVSDTPAPAVRHLDGLVAALATAEIHNLVHVFKPVQRYLVYDALRTELVPLQITPSTACPVCSPDLGVLGLGDLEPLPDWLRASQVELPPVLSAATASQTTSLAATARPTRPAPDTPAVVSPTEASTATGADALTVSAAAAGPALVTADRAARLKRLQALVEDGPDNW